MHALNYLLLVQHTYSTHCSNGDGDGDGDCIIVGMGARAVGAGVALRTSMYCSTYAVSLEAVVHLLSMCFVHFGLGDLREGGLLCVTADHH